MDSIKVKQNETIWNKVFICVFMTNFLIHLCTNSMNTLSSLYADYLGAAATVVGFVSGVFSISALIFKIFSAPAIDSFDRKKILLGAMFILFISMVGYALSGNVVTFVMFRLLMGVGQAFSTTVLMTIASDSLPVNKISTGIGYYTMTSAISQAIAPRVALILKDSLGFNKTFMVLAVVMIINILYAFTIKLDFVPTQKFTISIDRIIAREAFVMAIILFIIQIPACNVNSFLVLTAEERGISSNIGYFFTIYAITMIFSRPFIGKMADKIGPVKTLIPSMICYAVSFIIIGYANSLWQFLLAAFITAFGFGGSAPMIQALCMKSVGKDRRGAASCTSYMGTDLGNFVGPVLGGIIVERCGYGAMWFAMLIPMIIATFLIILKKQKLMQTA